MNKYSFSDILEYVDSDIYKNISTKHKYIENDETTRLKIYRLCDGLNYHVYQKAAEKGYLDCFKYAHENGCDWNKVECVCEEMFLRGR